MQIDTSNVAKGKTRMLAGSNGYLYVVTIIDTFNKAGWIIPVKTLTAVELLPLLRQLFEEWVTPDLLHSDNGGQFINKLMEQLTERLRVKHVTGPAMQPESQGQVERFNSTVKTRLFEWIHNNKDIAVEEWPTAGVKFVATEYNRKPHRTIHMSPNQFRLGIHKHRLTVRRTRVTP